MKSNCKKLFLSAFLSIITVALFAQAGQKWSVGGNSTSTTNFLGTTNAMPLVFKTNKTERLTIDPDGSIILNSFSMAPAGILRFDAGGKIQYIPFTNNSNEVLTGNGTFRNIQGFDLGWKVFGTTKIYCEPVFRVGIGTENPAAALDVNGNTIIRGTLHVFDGIIIGKSYTGEKAILDTVLASKMESDEMKSSQYKTNTIIIDGNNSRITSQTGEIKFDNNSLFAGSLHVSNLQVTGTTTQTNLIVQNHLQIGNSSLHLASTDLGTGTDNRIYSTNGDLLIQSESGSNYKTIINGSNDGYVGIGTVNPMQNLHIQGRTYGGGNNQNNTTSAVIRIEDVYDNGTIPNYTRTAYWDISSSAKQRGLYFSTDQGSGFSTPVEVMRLSENGQIVMGPTDNCSNPINIKLIVDGHILLTDGPTGEPRSLYWGYNCHPEWGIEYNSSDGGLNFWNPYTSNSGFANYRLFLQDGTGNVGIGTNNPEYKLDVCGTIRAKEVLIDLNGSCPDYVFEQNYNLMSLSDLKAYIDTNKHLPEIPSAKETEENGINLSEMNMMLLKKVEELTLYILQLEERVREMEESVK